MRPFVILVTGSRRWTEPEPIRDGLLWVMRHTAIPAAEIIVRHGAQGGPHGGVITGADMIADLEARALGMRVDPRPAKWYDPCLPACRPDHRRPDRDGRDYCPAAGVYRNQAMVHLGADICLAFPLPGSTGTYDCVRRAEIAHIRVIEHLMVVPKRGKPT